MRDLGGKSLYLAREEQLCFRVSVLDHEPSERHLPPCDHVASRQNAGGNEHAAPYHFRACISTIVYLQVLMLPSA